MTSLFTLSGKEKAERSWEGKEEERDRGSESDKEQSLLVPEMVREREGGRHK